MTKNPRRSLVAVAALGAVSLAGCSLATGATPVQLTPASPATVASTAPATVTATPVTAIVTPPPTPVTVTVAPPPPVAVPAAHFSGTGSFVSPSGNIACALFSYGGQTSVKCDVAEHSWVEPPQDPGCQLSWGSRVQLEQGGGAKFSCYAQNLPAPERTLAYGSTWSIGSITCDSESAGMTCTDGSTGHYFFVSRESYRIG